MPKSCICVILCETLTKQHAADINNTSTKHIKSTPLKNSGPSPSLGGHVLKKTAQDVITFSLTNPDCIIRNLASGRDLVNCQGNQL